jgi:membrane-bound lytic murein transglycosylase F
MSVRDNYYDHYFQGYTARLFEGLIDWQWMKAMALAESALNPEAVSSAGAVGVMQLMPGTSREMANLLSIPHVPAAPHCNIQMGIAYARRCFGIWQKESGIERIRFMLGSYNAGPGNILAAQLLAQKDRWPTDRWESISSFLPQVTGRHAEETIVYVSRVELFFAKLNQGEKS